MVSHSAHVAEEERLIKKKEPGNFVISDNLKNPMVAKVEKTSQRMRM